MKKRIFIIVGVIIIFLLGICGYLFFFTEFFGKKTLPVNIKSISISYVPSNNLDFNKEYLKVTDIKLDKGDLSKIKPLLRKINKTETKFKEINGKYKVTINKNCELIIGEDSSYVIRDKKKNMVKIGNDLYVEIENIVKKNNTKLYTKMNFKEIIIKKDSASINVKNKYNLELYNDYVSYLKIELSDKDLASIGEHKMEIILDSNIHIYIYNNNIAKIFNKEKNEVIYGVVDEKLYTISEAIYTSSTKK